jgi:D-lactate dehydratase
LLTVYLLRRTKDEGGDLLRNQELQDYIGFELYTELPDHAWFLVTTDFTEATADPARYDALIIPGGRFVESLVAEDGGGAVGLVKAFAGGRRPIVLTSHSQLLLTAAGTMAGVWCSVFFSLRLIIELTGGRWVEPDPFEMCVLTGTCSRQSAGPHTPS